MSEVAKVLDHPEANQKELSILDHMVELRKALIYSVITILICFCLTYYYATDIFEFLMQPVLNALGEEQSKQLHFTKLTEPFLTDLKVAFFAAVFLAAPMIFYQIWRFVAPGLYQKERRAIIALVLFSTLLFFAGVTFAYAVVFPIGFQFFLSYGSETLQPVLTMSEYLGLTIRLMLGFGIIFEMPIVILTLSLSGLVSAKDVAHFWRYAIVLMAILAAILTPPDVASMLLMMIPMSLLYGLSIILAAIFGRKKQNSEQH
jgi:sec-independent protein translocase protein TatC